MDKANQQELIRRRPKPSCFEWIQLIATICIPIIISIYSFVENNNSAAIAAESRRKDLDIANTLQMSDREIALANRLNELEIAQQSRQKDRELASDQQQQTILLEYQMFLANLILDNGANLKTNSEAKHAAIALTKSVLSQLNTGRRNILVRSLYNAKLITADRSNNQSLSGILDLQHVDLSNIIFSSLMNMVNLYQMFRRVNWDCLWLPGAILTNSSFREAQLNPAVFTGANMNSVDLSFTRFFPSMCSSNSRQSLVTDFSHASLIHANFYEADFRFTHFDGADLSYTNMYGLYCIDCTFSHATLFHANLSYSKIFNVNTFHPGRLNCASANFSYAVLHSAHYRSIDFNNTDWSNVHGTHIWIYNSTFIGATMDNCSFIGGYIVVSVFRSANLCQIELSNATLHNITIMDSDMRHANLSYMKCDYCHFSNVTLYGAILKNASIRYSYFLDCHIDPSQLEEVADLSGTKLPNGTVVENNY